VLADSPAVARWHRYRLWTIQRDKRTLSAEVVRVDGQWHLRFFAQGILFLWHSCRRLDVALEYAELIRKDLASERWH
jgi:hypothetical protein